jgi:PKHD-type hydroxylase
MKLNLQQQNIEVPLYCPAYMDNMFDSDEIKNIHKFVESIPIQTAHVGFGEKGEANLNTRRSNIKWIEPNNSPIWMQQKIVQAFQKINSEHFKFELTGAEAFQYTMYCHTDAGEYKWHADTAKFGNEVRKLSMSLLLSNPDDYVGGNLICAEHGNPIVMKEKLGRGIFFPSWVPHCVTPVTEGTRISLVIWAHGPMFK